MIIFDLICPTGHTFEGWFQSQDSFDEQRANALVSCPHCESSEVRRVPSAIHLAKPTNSPAVAEGVPRISTQSGLLSAYQQLVSLIVSNSEDVGKEFAQEARKIHYQEAPVRSIRGEASAEEYEELQDEGIEVLRLPVAGKEILN